MVYRFTWFIHAYKQLSAEISQIEEIQAKMHSEAADANRQLGLDIKVSEETSCTELIKQLDQKGIDFSIWRVPRVKDFRLIETTC